jgi:hypothetical protein
MPVRSFAGSQAQAVLAGMPLQHTKFIHEELLHPVKSKPDTGIIHKVLPQEKDSPPSRALRAAL